MSDHTADVTAVLAEHWDYSKFEMLAQSDDAYSEFPTAIIDSITRKQ